jgi:hypothetical protein
VVIGSFRTLALGRDGTENLRTAMANLVAVTVDQRVLTPPAAVTQHPKSH